jgi:hypothetical protein
MAYSDFTFAKLKRNFGIEQEYIHLFQNVTIKPFVLRDFFVIFIIHNLHFKV